MTTGEYNQCVDAHADGLYRFIVKNLKDEEKSRDVVQDTFEKLWLKVGEVNFSKAKSYMFTTAYHTMIDKIRRDKKQSVLTEMDLEKQTYQNTYSDLNEILNEALDKLPANQKTVILLRDYEGYSYQEISEITKLTESQVKVNIFRGRKFLKKYIGSIEAVI